MYKHYPTPNETLHVHFDPVGGLDQLMTHLTAMREEGTTPKILGQTYRILSSGMGKGVLQTFVDGKFQNLADLSELANYLREEKVILPDWLAVWATPREANVDYQWLVEDGIKEYEMAVSQHARYMREAAAQLTEASKEKAWDEVVAHAANIVNFHKYWDEAKDRLEMLENIKKNAEKGRE